MAPVFRDLLISEIRVAIYQGLGRIREFSRKGKAMDLRLTKRDSVHVAAAMCAAVKHIECAIDHLHNQWRLRKGENDWCVAKHNRPRVARLRRDIVALNKIIARIEESQAKGES